MDEKPVKRLGRRNFLKVALGASSVALLAACAQPTQPSPAPAATKATQPTTAAPAPAATQPAAAATKPAAAATQAPAAQVGTGTIRIAIGVDPDTLEPLGQTTTTVQNIVDYMCESLVTLGDDGQIHPALAESWTMEPGGTAYTFKLRQGVTFHDGAPFNAEAVKGSWERALSPNQKVPLLGVMRVVQRVEAVDANTVRFQLKNPFPPFVSAMVQSFAAILSPNVVKNFATSYNEEPVGTGPYKFKSRTKGSEVVLERNENYWGKKPYYQTVQFRVVPEAATRESLVLAGQAEVIILPPVSDIPKLQQNKQVKVILGKSNRTIYVAIDCTRPGPTQEAKFRQALNYAVDKEGIIKSVLFGGAEPMDAPMSSMLWGHCKTGPYKYDPDMAKKLLSEGGWSGASLKFMHPTGRYVQDAPAAQAIAGNLRDVGLNVETSTADWPTYLATAVQVPADKGTVDMHMLGWAPGYLDASQQMVQFQTANWPPAGLNSAHYGDPTVDDLLVQAAKNTDEKTRATQYCDASKKIWEDAPWIFLWVQAFPVVHSVKVKNVGTIATEKFSCLYAEPA